MVLGEQASPVSWVVAAPETRNTLFFSRDDLGDRERDRGGRHVDDHVDALDVDPLADDVGADVGLVLVVGRQHLDRRAAERRRSPRPPCAPPRPSPARRDRRTGRTGRSCTPILTAPPEISACAAPLSSASALTQAPRALMLMPLPLCWAGRASALHAEVLVQLVHAAHQACRSRSCQRSARAPSDSGGRPRSRRSRNSARPAAR